VYAVYSKTPVGLALAFGGRGTVIIAGHDAVEPLNLGRGPCERNEQDLGWIDRPNCSGTDMETDACKRPGI